MKDIFRYVFSSKKRVLMLSVFGVIYVFLFAYIRKFEISREQIDAFIAVSGINGALVIYLMQTILSLTPIPDGALTIFAVVLFGPWKAFVAVFFGMLTASTIHYFLARKYGKRVVTRWFPQASKYSDRFGENTTIEDLIIYRFFAFVSFDIVAYLAGMSGVPFRRYLVSAIFGFIPIIFANVVIAMGLFANNIFELFLTWILAGSVAIGIALLTKLARKQLEKNGKNGKK